MLRTMRKYIIFGQAFIGTNCNLSMDTEAFMHKQNCPYEVISSMKKDTYIIEAKKIQCNLYKNNVQQYSSQWK